MSHGPGGAPVLCLHGFTSTPLSVRYLALYLKRNGWQAHSPLLSGHGGTPGDLARSRWRDWYATADAELTKMVDAADRPVAVVGSSMGGLLALELALARPRDVSAIVLMATPIRLPRWQERGLRLCRKLLPEFVLRSPLVSWPSGRDELSGTGPRSMEVSAPNSPIGAAASMLELAESLRPRLGEVHLPTLLVHSTKDPSVPFAASQELESKLGSEALKTLWLYKSGHLVCLDADRQTVFETVAGFLASHHT